MTEKVKAVIRASKYLDEKSRRDVLELLGHLEGELQAKDVAIATLKSECLKNLLYNLRDNRDALRDPILALGRDGTKVLSCKGSDPDSVEQHIAHRYKVLQTLVEAQKAALKKLTNCLREAEVQKANLIRDLNDERRKRELDTAQGDDITYCLEKDRSNLKQELETESEEKSRLQSEVETITQKLKDEQNSKKQIILTLVEDRKKMAALYLEEKKRSEDLNRLLREERSKVNSLGLGLEEESKRSLAMEDELETTLVQVSTQKEEISSLKLSVMELEDALRRARQEADHFKKQLAEAHRVAMSQASTAAVAVSAVNVSSQLDPVNESPYPKWSSSTPASVAPSQDGFQVKSVMNSMFEKDGGLNNNRTMTSSSTIAQRGLAQGSGLACGSGVGVGIGSTITAMPGSAETTRLKNSSHSHTKVLGKKVPLGGGMIKVGVPPPVPPNKPAMTALYKSMAAMKLDPTTAGGSEKK